MDIQPTSQQPISDDQELAKVLAGITAGADADLAADLEEESVTPATDTDDAVNVTVTNNSSNTAGPIMPTEPVVPTQPAPAPTMAPAVDGGLEAIKHDALNELRPLVDKLNLSAEEKFDTYLLLIRSTDDTTLVAPAFEAARAIADETERAQALFDIVKEIDYLSNPQK